MSFRHPNLIPNSLFGQFKKEETISSQIIKEVGSRINFLLDVGLDYLTLHRSANTLSGGESMQDMGKVMGLLKNKLSGKADMGLVSIKVKESLG